MYFSVYQNLFLYYILIFLKIPSSAGSHFTEWRVSLVSHAAASCSLRCIDSDINEHMKQCIVRWKFGYSPLSILPPGNSHQPLNSPYPLWVAKTLHTIPSLGQLKLTEKQSQMMTTLLEYVLPHQQKLISLSLTHIKPF